MVPFFRESIQKSLMNDEDIQGFWDAHPCGEAQVGGLKDDYEEFFRRYDEFRYKQHNHLLNCLDRLDLKDKRILEIGLGLGADSEQIIRRGAVWSGVDLTAASVERVAKRLELRSLPCERLEVASVYDLPFEADSFDMVFAHGVLHHVRLIHQAQAEIHRVLKRNGKLVAMLYAKNSVNYWASIFVLRRVALGLIYTVGWKPKGVIGQHLDNARKMGLFRYLRMENFIHKNTDGPLNPYSKVYNLDEVRKDFPCFRVAQIHKEFMHAPPLPAGKLPLARFLGWHLWVHMIPVGKQQS